MNKSLYDSFINIEKLYHFYYVYLSTYKHAFKRIKEIAVYHQENENITEQSIFTYNTLEMMQVNQYPDLY